MGDFLPFAANLIIELWQPQLHPDQPPILRWLLNDKEIKIPGCQAFPDGRCTVPAFIQMHQARAQQLQNEEQCRGWLSLWQRTKQAFSNKNKQSPLDSQDSPLQDSPQQDSPLQDSPHQDSLQPTWWQRQKAKWPRIFSPWNKRSSQDTTRL